MSEHQQRVLFRPAFVDLLEGDHLAALMLSQIVYWYTPNKLGHARLRASLRGRRVLVKTHAEWWNELRLTKKQVHRCMAVLKNSGFIKTEVHLFAGKTSTFVQLVAHPKLLQALPEMPQGTSWMFPWALPEAPVGTSITETTTETTTESVTTLAESSQENPMKAKDVIQKMMAKEVNPGKGPLAMSILWKKHMGLHTQGFVKSLTGQELGQLKHVHKALGDEAYSVLEYALTHWQKFAHEAAAKHGVVVATSPTCAFFCKHYDVAAQLIAEDQKPKPVVKAIAEAVKVKSKPEEPLAGEQDVQETLEQLKALKKS